MIFVDSSVWIDYFNGNETPETEKLDSVLGSSPVCIGDIVLTEVMQGYRNDTDFDTAKELLSSLIIVNVPDTSIALKSANNFRALRKKGVTVRKTIDVIIATYCIEKDIPLLYSDKDFIPFHEHLNLRNALINGYLTSQIIGCQNLHSETVRHLAVRINLLFNKTGSPFSRPVSIGNNFSMVR